VASSPLTGGMPWTAIIGAIGALQLATILRQPLPAKGYEKGLYPEHIRREQDGKVFKASYGGKTKSGRVDKPTYFLTGENGPEMIIDSKAYSELSPSVREALTRELRGIKGFENGYYKKGTFYTGPENPEPNNTPGVNPEILLQLLLQNKEVMFETLEVLKDLKEEGVVGVFRRGDYRSFSELDKGLKDYKDFKNKSKA
jgi:hypothetical protein